MNCSKALSELAQDRTVTLIWVQGHSDSDGNLKADILAKKGVMTMTHGPEPFLGWKEKKCRSICDSWVQELTY